LDWIVENWSIVAFIISFIFSIAIFILKQKGKNTLVKKLQDVMGIALDRDEVLRRTFLNVEELKKVWTGLEQDKKIGELFKGWNENVGMEPLIRGYYLRLVGKEIGLVDDDKTEEVKPEEKPPEVGSATVG